MTVNNKVPEEKISDMRSDSSDSDDPENAAKAAVSANYIDRTNKKPSQYDFQ